MEYEIVKHVSSKTDAQVVAEYTGTEGRQTVYFPTDAYRIYATGKIMASRYEADLLWGGKNFSGDFSPLDASLLYTLGANRSAFLPASIITVQYSTNGGSSWADSGLSDEDKMKLFAGVGSGVKIGKNTGSGVSLANLQLRVIITNTIGKFYTTLNKFIINVSTEKSTGCWCSIDAMTQANALAGNDTWTNFANKAGLSGWSGYNVINTSAFSTCGYDDNTSQYSKIRFTFGCTGGTSDANYKGLRIINIYCFGGVGWVTPSLMASTGHIYSWDVAQNASFPALVRSTGFKKSNSSDSYVLLGGGGHKSLDDLRPVKVNGTSVQTSATLDFINGDGISITEGSPNNGSIKIAADIKKVNATSFTAPSTPTVANYKTTLASVFNQTPYCVGRNVTVSDQLVYHWGEDSYTVQPSSVFQMTEIGGYSHHTNFGQWLLSSYGDRRLGVVGMANGSWTEMKWLAFTSDIPTNTNQLTNGAGFITGITSTMVINALGYTPSQTDTKVTQTVTSSANSSTRPLLIGDSYSDAPKFAPATTTASAYATHLAKFAPSTGILSLVGLTKMKTDGTMDTASDTKVWNTNGGVTDISGKQDKVTAKGSTIKPLYTSDDGTFAECTKYAGGTLVALNGTVKSGDGISIYAPTSGGTSGQFLKSNGGSNAPTFETVKELTDIKTTDTPASPSRVLQNCKIGGLELPIYDCISTVDSNGKLNHVTGKAVYILDARLMTRSGQSIPVSCKRYSGTPSASAHWKITIPSDFTGSISNAYCYVKFVYDASASGSGVNT